MLEQFPANYLQFPPRLGELLIGQGLLTKEQVSEALAHKEEQGLFLGQSLVELGFLTEEDLVRALRSQQRFEAIHLTPDIVEPELPDELGYERCSELGVLPINRIAGHVTVAMGNPADLLRVQELTGLLRTKLLPVYAQPRRIQEALDAYFGHTAEPPAEPEIDDETLDSEIGAALGMDLGDAPGIDLGDAPELGVSMTSTAAPEEATAIDEPAHTPPAKPPQEPRSEQAPAPAAAEPKQALETQAPQAPTAEPEGVAFAAGTTEPVETPAVESSQAPVAVAAAVRQETPDATERLDAFVRMALESGARALHFEAAADALRVRARTASGMHEQERVSRTCGHALVQDLRKRAGLSPRRAGSAETTRFAHECGGRRVELVLTTMAGAHGECAVVELVSGTRDHADLASTGLGAEQRADLEALCDAGAGLLLTAGPVGSGRRSFLRALLAHSASPERLAVTVEGRRGEPLAEVVELACGPDGEGTAEALRAAARLQPDLVHVGELRDRASAALATQAALTGTLVLSSVTTLGALDAIQRLRDLGVTPQHLADGLRGVVGQRLVRRPCPACGVAVEPAPERFAELSLEAPDDATFLELGPGCEHCDGSGATGRCGLFELLPITPALRALLAASAPLEELARQAYADGFRDLLDTAFATAAVGDVALSEALVLTARGRTRPSSR